MKVIIEINGTKYENRETSFFSDLTCNTCALHERCEQEKKNEDLPCTRPIKTICRVNGFGFKAIREERRNPLDDHFI